MAAAKKTAIQERFLRFIREQKLIAPGEKVLLTVSGGVDSVVMVHLFHQAGFQFYIAHCNFKLRGSESDGDAAFVKALASQLSVPYFETSFETETYAKKHGLSIQMAARELRYNWFKELAEKENYQLIATAHHRNDLVETVLLNLVKGSVLKGLAGIPVRNENIIRPLLFAGKDELLQIALENKISYREDSSNAHDKYGRNLIRNQVIPLLEKINPALPETVSESSDARKELADWLEEYIQQNLVAELQEEKGSLKLSLDVIRQNQLQPIHLYQWLGEYGFHYTELKKLFASLESTEALEFSSSTHRLIKERNELVLMPLGDEKSVSEIQVEKGRASAVFGDIGFEFSEIRKPAEIDFSDSSIAWLDADKIRWPLTIRIWKPGDYFYPAGFGKKKKLSDYLTDIKLSKTDKEKQLVLVSGDDIVWVVGLRVDERCKVEERTKKFFRISIHDLKSRGN